MNKTNNTPGGKARASQESFRFHQSIAGQKRAADSEEMQRIGRLGGKRSAELREFSYLIGITVENENDIKIHVSRSQDELPIDCEKIIEWQQPLIELRLNPDFARSFFESLLERTLGKIRWFRRR